MPSLKSEEFGRLLEASLSSAGFEQQKVQAAALGKTASNYNKLVRGKLAIDHQLIDLACRLLAHRGHEASARELSRAFVRALALTDIPEDSEEAQEVLALMEKLPDALVKNKHLDALVGPALMCLNNLCMTGRSDEAFFLAEEVWSQIHDSPSLSPRAANVFRSVLRSSAKAMSLPRRVKRLLHAMSGLGADLAPSDPIVWGESLDAEVRTDYAWRGLASSDALPKEYKGWRRMGEESGLDRSRRTYFHDPQLDAYLALDPNSHRPEIGLVNPTGEEKFKLSKDARDIAPYPLNRAFKSDSVVFDAGKTRLADDILYERLSKGKPIKVGRTTYYAAIATNGATGFPCSRPDGSLIYSGLSLFTNGESKYRCLLDSECANILGISVLALTSDGYLLIQTQSDQNHQSANSLVPSGSGSVEWSDASGATSFDQMLHRAAVRELLEETGMSQSEKVVDFRILGYTLEATRGLKPDFFAFARLKLTAEQVLACGGRLEGFTNKQEPYRLRIDDLDDAVSDIDKILDLPVALNEFLLINLYLLRVHLQNSTYGPPTSS